MYIVFINYHIFEGNSGLHIHPLANELVLRGHNVTVLVPERPEKKSTLPGKSLYNIVSYSDTLSFLGYNDLVFFAWTPRELVRKKTLELVEMYDAPYYVHLEDNEDQLVADYLKKSWSQIQKMEISELEGLIPLNLSIPIKYRDFLAKANGVSCIIKTLEEFVPETTPRVTFWPSCENEIFTIPLQNDYQTRNKLAIKPDDYVIFYPGNVHLSNVLEVIELYKAVKILNQKRNNILLIHTGQNYVDLNQFIDINESYFWELGERPLNENINYIAVSNLLIQPGADNNFNHYRFPSKLPLFLASGRPVIIGETNLGTSLTDWENCIKFVHGDAEELAHKVALLIDKPELSRYIGRNGRQFAIEHFNWIKSTDILEDFIMKTFNKKLYNNGIDK